VVEALDGYTVVLRQMNEVLHQGINILGSAKGIVVAGVRVGGGGDLAEIVIRGQFLAVQLLVLFGAPIVLSELTGLPQLQVVDALVAGRTSRVGLNQDTHGALKVEGIFITTFIKILDLNLVQLI